MRTTGVLDVARRDHHQIRELVNHDEKVRIGRIDTFTAQRGRELCRT